MYKLFKTLGSKSRLRILKMLLIRKYCVCEISGILNLSDSTISEHLKKLKKMNLIREQKQSYWNYYYINPEIKRDKNMKKLLNIIKSLNNSIYQKDRKKIKNHVIKCNNINKGGNK
ncbi:MAG: winged helix-turn-helix transcriptional regulator [Candidatus Mcinerneyibacterium aminivorans]|uniref:Winged helix-turn-helix transcriptional regulator n=1 Tax=Candidatus Mcinerneyibacterium aminivorans TaxID=2703815 RepID=A0A5D0MG65_9BACT|nr:MAG: winged helix-turn-helix transcriptional regulator [Candidatus Mcinerneyibacterium aminivorans]